MAPSQRLAHTILTKMLEKRIVAEDAIDDWMEISPKLCLSLPSRP